MGRRNGISNGHGNDRRVGRPEGGTVEARAFQAHEKAEKS